MTLKILNFFSWWNILTNWKCSVTFWNQDSSVDWGHSLYDSDGIALWQKKGTFKKILVLIEGNVFRLN